MKGERERKKKRDGDNKVFSNIINQNKLEAGRHGLSKIKGVERGGT